MKTTMELADAYAKAQSEYLLYKTAGKKELNEARAALAQRIEQLEKDAGRYRLTQTNPDFKVCKWHIDNGDQHYSWWAAKESEIDAAMKGETP
jgi:hypothetical protein